ncbi:xanthine dehydrogenase family Fe-S subunit [Ancylobacter pratisalsi]|uniref:2Fe-2S iron-sulfur cluster binding domain-containing protein n=1 Tax=Ancylobacter pratisalsi TaxID=1745854 RepID=A0A6P1YQQ4_9HYPH|nr:2Fe-2S iron-sulfur cluster-binding protein [Ancylobacter pratisalsi]QIB35365.1 2Fe-2S iron-sulfur cluster binding domain-containing protein [Ancylobacter pratisalsi]
MKPVRIEINGRPITAEVEPRQHLADFMREELLLTGTHLGCEHGVCGACTVLIDGAPARSCIAYPVALDGAKITTIEGLIDDPVMVCLREAFTREHGLQCGFCTPGMLIMARDIVLRRPGLDEEAIRHELAGNLCRCTGYVGIVRAIQSVAQERVDAAPVVTRGSEVNAPHYASPLALPVTPARIAAADPVIAPGAAPADEAAFVVEPLRNPVEIVQEFNVSAPRAQVWELFQDPARVIACLPGARLTQPCDGRNVVAEMAVKLGPIQAAFGGVGMIASNPANWSGTIDGRGVDSRSATRIQARLNYVLTEIEAGAATRVRVDVAYVLQGPLAQMSRGALARDLAARMTAAFAANLDAAIKGNGTASAAAPLDAGSLFFAVVKAWLARLFGRG